MDYTKVKIDTEFKVSAKVFLENGKSKNICENMKFKKITLTEYDASNDRYFIFERKNGENIGFYAEDIYSITLIKSELLED